jgi:CRP-like cAMP-binding protein
LINLGFRSVTPGLERVLDEAFPNSRAETRRWLVESVEVTQHGSGEYLFRQGSRTPVLVVLDGWTAFQRTSPDGRVVIPRLAGPGQVAGLLGVSDLSTPVDMLAITGVRTAGWSATTIRSAAAADSGLALDTVDQMAVAMDLLSERLDSLPSQEPVLTRGHLAGLVGTSAEMTRRVLRRLEEMGVVVRVGRSSLQLLDEEQLAGLADLPGSP